MEATKFTEVGYVGRDVDQIMRDLVEQAMAMIRDKRRAGVRAKAEAAAEDRILDALVGPGAQPATRDSFRKKLRASELDDKEVELNLADIVLPMQGFDIPGQPGGVHGGAEPVGHDVQGVRRPHQGPQDHGVGRLCPADRRGERQALGPGRP